MVPLFETGGADYGERAEPPGHKLHRAQGRSRARRVYVLDPCCGTGAYLVEVLKTISATLAEKGDDALPGALLKKAAMERVFGFEILPAPFVVAHLQMGLFLQGHGTVFDEKKKERAGVFLTNALTGWQPPAVGKRQLVFSELEEERDKAGIVEPYRATKTAPKPQGQGLNDLYVRFWRIAERCITERNAQHGIVCYISNYSWLDGRSHTGMRERFLEEFDRVWIDSLNGDKYKTGKTTPDGQPDPSVFSTPQNREGIQVGTAVALLARLPHHHGPAEIQFRDYWGTQKREELFESFANGLPAYVAVQPVPGLALAFRPMQTDSSYVDWPLLPNLFPTTFPGVFTARDQFVVDIDEEDLRARVAAYFDADVSHSEMGRISPQAMQIAK